MKYNNYWTLLEYRKEFDLIKKIEVLKWYWADEFNEVEEYIYSRTSNSGNILDYGAGQNKLKKKFIENNYQGKYLTFDINEEYEHDFHELSEIKSNYETIIMLEVIEHMELSDFVKTFEALESHLSKDGLFIISTPHPASVYPSEARDMTHISNYPPKDLWAFFRLRNYTCEIRRVILFPLKSTLVQKFRLFLKRILCYILGIEYVDGYIIIAKKNN